MTILVVGASGATGQLLVDQLLKRGHHVKAIIRSPEKLPEILNHRDQLSVIYAGVLELTDEEMARHVKGCHGVASCLGHNMSWKGIYGQPRKLVTDAARRLCDVIKENKSENTTRFVLMNTAGNSNRDLHEPVSFGQRCVIGLLRLLLPPHVDNENAADFLRTKLDHDNRAIEWAVVRPDNLIDEDEVTEYEIHPSPIRSAIFNAGQTSRINVGHFMAELITDDATWKKWKGQMPVIYNRVRSD
ncbi:MAG: SDR family oxidoreductase [Saprospiraceae bacterium]|nr:SDR family oxidoreductase [Saprospiraceae bacterium]